METYWIDADNKKHEIVEMSDKYIKNCIKQIKIAVQNNAGKSLEYIERYDEDKVLSPKWTKERAQSYLDTFNDELEIRDRIKKSDFPKIPKSCESCNERNECVNSKKNVACDRWSFDNWCIHDLLDGIDYEVARRSSVKIISV